MVSKCANPACSEVFMHLHEGKVFHLSPTPGVEEATGGLTSALCERFWLCERCSKRMTMVWGGSEIRLLPLLKQPIPPPAPTVVETERKKNPRRRPSRAIAFE